MIDTIEFVLHEVNSRQLDLTANTGTSFKNPYNQLIYERLMEYESIYIERTKDFNAYQEHLNPDGSDFKRKEIGKNFVMSSRRGVFTLTQILTKFFSIGFEVAYKRLHLIIV